MAISIMNYNTPAPHPIDIITVESLDGLEEGKLARISKPVTTIGHDLSNDIRIQSIAVSPEFARIISNNGSWILQRMSQDILIKVNDHVVSSREVLHNGDTIGFGPTMAEFRFNNPLERGYNKGIDAAAGESSHDPVLEISSNTSQIRKTCTLPPSMSVINIGRDPSNEVVIDELVMDQFHLQIIREDNQLKLVHPHPRVARTENGLWYHGEYYGGTEHFERPLSQGDIFYISNEYGTTVILTYHNGNGSASDAPLEPTATIPLDDAHRKIVIGRQLKGDPESSLQLDHPAISGLHAILVKGRKGYRIVDESSVGHVYVNGRAVRSGHVKPGDEIRIGPYRLDVTDSAVKAYDERNSIRIDAYDLYKIGKKKKVLLNTISLVVRPGSFVALVGGSGAGKSTLIDALNGIRPAHGGYVYYNGQDYYSSLAAFRTQIGYVPQDDIVHKDLTVARALFYAARLRLPKDIVQKRIDDVLKIVKLEVQRKQLIKDLSGGQRKRVSIALELLAEPSVFFLDEPTSGLDPGLDREMMNMLRELADRGHTIVLVTHATTNINVCHYVCFLCQGGRMAYFGPPKEAVTYFKKSDFAEIYSSLEPTETNREIPAEAEKRFKKSDEYKKYVKEVLQPRPAQNMNTAKRASALPKRGNPWKQFFWLSLRYVELLNNDRVTLAVLLLQSVIIAGILALIVRFLLGASTFDTSVPGPNAEKTLFIMAFAAVFFGSLNAAREIVKESSIYARERAVNLGILPYLFSKFVVLGILCLIQCAVLVLFIDAASNFRKGIFLPITTEIYITLVLTSLVGLAMGLWISAFARNSDRAASLIPIVLIPQVIFSGIIFKLSGGALFLGDVFAVRWAMIAMGSSIDLNGKLVDADSFAFQYSGGHLLLAWGVLMFMIVFFGCLTAFFLKRKDVRRRKEK